MDKDVTTCHSKPMDQCDVAEPRDSRQTRILMSHRMIGFSCFLFESLLYQSKRDRVAK